MLSYGSLTPTPGRIIDEDFKGIINIFGPLGLETQVFQYLRRVITYLVPMGPSSLDIYKG
jgi:hypothetical protein